MMSEGDLSGSFMPPELEELHTLSARLTRKREQERHRIDKLETMKSQLASELIKLRQACGPAGPCRVRAAAGPTDAKHIPRLENRLEQKQTKLSEAALVNAKLRLQINGEPITAKRRVRV